jgi:predicted protein tyrosine phosphatase
VHKYDFKNKKENVSYQKDVHKTFDKIANQTLLKVTMNKVLVHCQMGRSRSATMVIMYLLYKQLVDVCDDFDCDINIITNYVKERRIIIDPNTGFLDQLNEFEHLVKSGEMRKLVKAYDKERKATTILNTDEQGQPLSDEEINGLEKNYLATKVMSIHSAD